MQKMYFDSEEKSSSRSRSREKNAIQDPELDFVQRAQFEEMYQEKNRRRSRSRERKIIHDLEGNDNLIKQLYAAKTMLDFPLGYGVPLHGNSIDLEFKHASSKKANRAPVKALVNKELPKQIEIKRSPTNLIARLMGLDTLPPAPITQKKETSSQKKSYNRKHANKEVKYIHMKNNEDQECKDVYEIMKKPEFEKQEDKQFRKAMLSLESKEYNDALEDTYCDPDIFRKFLHEPNSMFRMHLQDLQSSPPSPHVNHITILKPSTKYDDEICNGSKRKIGHSVKEHKCSLPSKSSPPYTGKTKNRYQSADIVVLKPSLEKARGLEAVAKSNNHKLDFNGQNHNSTSRKERHKLYNNVEFVHHKGLRELARDVTIQLRAAAIGSNKMTGTETLDYNNHKIDHSDSLSASSYYSTECKVSREARKHLSQRWKKIQQTQGKGFDNKGSSTLGDLLVCDRETPRTFLNKSIIRNLENQKFPMSISSKEGWKEKVPTTLLRSKSLPASLLVYESYKPSKRSKVGVRDHIYLQHELNKKSSRKSSTQSLRYSNSNAQTASGREEVEICEKEIQANTEDSHSWVHSGVSRHDSEEDCNDQHAEQFKDLAEPVNDKGITGTEANYKAIKETSVDHSQANYISSQCDVSESPSSISSKEDQPSPISVLELPPFEEDKSNSECFEKISADLKELRMQLRLLKLESADTDDENLELVISSDDDDEGESDSTLHNSEAILDAFSNDEDRDYYYLLDVLIDFNVHPIGKEVFQKLEKKYSKLSSWSRSERKLFFDLINFILADLQTMKFRRFSPSFNRECLVEEVWQLVVKQRMEMSGKIINKVLMESGWLDYGEDRDSIGKELEREIIDDLIEEII